MTGLFILLLWSNSRIFRILGFGVVVVVRSEKEGFKAGDYLYGLTVWEAYTVQPYVDGMFLLSSHPHGHRLMLAPGRINFKPEEWAPGTFDMDSLALQVVPNPNGLYPLSKYTSIMGTPGLTAFVGMEGIIDGKEVRPVHRSHAESRAYFVNSREKLCSYRLEHLQLEGEIYPYLLDSILKFKCEYVAW